MAIDKKKIENLEISLGRSQDRLSKMEVGFVDRFHQLKDTLRRLTDTLVLNREESSSNAPSRPGQTQPNCDNGTEKSDGGRPPFYSDAKSVAFAGDMRRSLTHGGGGTGEDGNLQIDRIDERDVISKQFSASLDDAQMQTIGTDDKIVEVYEIDMEKLENLLSLLQSSVGDALVFCLANMDWNLHQEFVVKVLRTPYNLGEILIMFFKWAMKKPKFKLTRSVMEALVHGVSTGLRKRKVYAFGDLIKEVGEKENGLLSIDILNELIASLSKLSKGKTTLEVFNKFGEFGRNLNAEIYYFTIEAPLLVWMVAAVATIVMNGSFDDENASPEGDKEMTRKNLRRRWVLDLMAEGMWES